LEHRTDAAIDQIQTAIDYQQTRRLRALLA
jgi:hypothetical protein